MCLFPFLVYTETFAPSPHLASLLEADQDRGIITLCLIPYHSTQWVDWAHTEIFLCPYSLLTFPGRGEIVHSIKNHRLKSSLCWVVLAMLDFLTVSCTFFFWQFLYLSFIFVPVVQLLLVSHIYSACWPWPVALLQLGAVFCLKHGKAGLRSCSE